MDKIVIGTNKFKTQKSLGDTSVPALPTNAELSLLAKSFISEALTWENMDGYIDCGVTKPWTQGPMIAKAIAELESKDESEMA